MAAVESLPLILDAASRHATKLRELVLLCGPVKNQPLDAQKKTADALNRALGQWYVHNGGLRLITIPSWVTIEPSAYAAFFAALAAYCPKLELLIPRMKMHPVNSQLRKVNASLPLDVWAAFCHKCTAYVRYGGRSLLGRVTISQSSLRHTNLSWKCSSWTPTSR